MFKTRALGFEAFESVKTQNTPRSEYNRTISEVGSQWSPLYYTSTSWVSEQGGMVGDKSVRHRYMMSLPNGIGMSLLTAFIWLEWMKVCWVAHGAWSRSFSFGCGCDGGPRLSHVGCFTKNIISQDSSYSSLIPFPNPVSFFLTFSTTAPMQRPATSDSLHLPGSPLSLFLSLLRQIFRGPLSPHV